MSLCRSAVRIALVEALKGRTEAGTNVLDSRIGAIEIGKAGGVVTDQTKPFVAVYTADGAAKIEDLRALHANGEVWIQIDFGVTAAMQTIAEDGTSEILPGIPSGDDDFEFILDLIGRQIVDTLSDPDSVWAEVWRGLILHVSKVETEGARNSEEGSRLAARQFRLACVLVDDPVRGEHAAEEGVLGAFFAAAPAIAEPEIAERVRRMHAAIGPAETRDWHVDQRRSGMTRGELLALGRGPIAQDEERLTPEFGRGANEIEIEIETRAVP